MALKKKTNKATTKPSVKNIDEIINKGGSTPSESTKKNDKLRKFQIRVDSSIVDRIDTLIDANPVKMSRNSWIVNALLQQLQKEEK